jgi:hypothetical protein
MVQAPRTCGQAPDRNCPCRAPAGADQQTLEASRHDHAGRDARLVRLRRRTVYFDFWRAPSPVYFETLIDPIYAMFAAYAVVRVGAILRDVVARDQPNTKSTLRRLQTIASAIAIIPAAAVAGSLYIDRVPRIYGPAPPTRPPLVALLAEEIAITPGSVFRGRVATILLQNRPEPAGWGDMITAALPRLERMVSINGGQRSAP